MDKKVHYFGCFLVDTQYTVDLLNVLSQKRNFLVSLLDQFGDLRDNTLYGSGLFDAPCGGYDTKSTSLIAAINDIDPCCYSGLSSWFGGIFHNMGGLRGNDLIAIGNIFEQISNSIGVLRPHDEINFGTSPQESFSFLLRDTSRDNDGDIFSFPLSLCVGTNVAVYLLLGVISNGTGVEDDNIWIVSFGGGVWVKGLQAETLELSFHPFRVGTVHLAAHGFQLVGFYFLWIDIVIGNVIAGVGVSSFGLAKRHFANIGHDIEDLDEVKANGGLEHDNVAWLGGDLHDLAACLGRKDEVEVFVSVCVCVYVCTFLNRDPAQISALVPRVGTQTDLLGQFLEGNDGGANLVQTGFCHFPRGKEDVGQSHGRQVLASRSGRDDFPGVYF